MDINNAVINGVLCYLSSARHTLTDQAMITVCLSFYNGEKISEAKEILFKITKDSIIRRRGESKARADLQDIITLMRKIDEKNQDVPQFLSDSFRSMPPASGFEAISEHITNLTTEISTLKTEIRNLKTSDDRVDYSMTDMKEVMYDIKNILLQHFTDSKVRSNTVAKNITDTGLLFSDIVSLPPTTKNNTSNSGTSAVSTTRVSTENTSTSVINGNCNEGEGRPTTGSNRFRKRSYSNNGDNDRIMNSVPHMQLEGVEPDGSGGDNGWQRQHSRRKKNDIIRGTKKITGSLKGAKTNSDLYIGKCDSSVTIEIISNYIKNESDIDVIECVCLNEYEGGKSFRVTLSFEDRLKLLSSTMWPENIVVRKFYSSKNKNKR